MEERKFTEVVEKYSEMVYRIAFHDCRNRQDGEDVMQTVFLKLYQKAPAFDSEEHLKRWLIRVTVNECRRLFASPWKKKTETAFSLEQGERDQEEPYETAEKRLLLDMVLGLPRKYRIPVYLYYYEGYSVKEIAKLLQRKDSTVQTWLDRARKNLRKRLEEVGFYET